MAITTLDDLIQNNGGLQGKVVFVRSDLNVPLRDGEIQDLSRVRASVPTLARLREAGARVVVSSHLGRPKGRHVPGLSLRVVASALGDALGTPVRFCPACTGSEAQQAAASLQDGEVLLLENLRFHKEETDNDPGFAKELAALADIYVNDAFGTAHRAHASTEGITNYVQQKAAGDLLLNELVKLGMVLEPQRPLVCFLGGAKVSDKLAALEALAPHADVLCIGGGMAYTFLYAQGISTGNSLLEKDSVEDARKVMAAAEKAGKKLLLPQDHLAAREFSEEGETRVFDGGIEDGWMGLDIGPKTAELYANEAMQAKTIFWNGPMGVFEMERFAVGTEAVAHALANSEAYSVVGGGDSLAAINKLGYAKQITHLSTGGGASLEYIQGIALPGVEALEN
jgi:3-phosphoglycerate kinase